MVKVEGLVSRYGDNLVHDGLDLTVNKGEILGLVGGSGAGKSVLLNTIIGLREPDAGRIEVLGVDVRNASERVRHALEARWGVLFRAACSPALTVRENVGAPLIEHIPACRARWWTTSRT